LKWLLFRLFKQTLFGVGEILTPEIRQFVHACHLDGLDRTSFNAVAAEYAAQQIYLIHRGVLSSTFIFVGFDGYTFSRTRSGAQVASYTFLMILFGYQAV